MGVICDIVKGCLRQLLNVRVLDLHDAQRQGLPQDWYSVIRQPGAEADRNYAV